MRRQVLVYALIAAVMSAAGGLAYYGYSYSAGISSRERAQTKRVMSELAAEKVVTIESELLRGDKVVFDGVDIEDLRAAAKLLEQSAVARSVLVLDRQGRIMADGFFTRRERTAEIDGFREIFAKQVIADLRLDSIGPNARGHLHRFYNGRPYLFSYAKRFSAGRTYYVVVETDLTYLVDNVFGIWLGNLSPTVIYQVVDADGEVWYGLEFTGRPDADTVEMPFTETVSLWQLRAAQREVSSSAQRDKRRVLDLVLIGIALAVILAGITILLIAMRRERRANELKSDFISNVSHELKTPLSIISMFGEMLAMGRTKSAEQSTEYAEIIWRESVRLARLIDNVLDFAKMERGVDVYEFGDGDVGDVVARALELSRHRLARAELEVDLDIEEELPMLQIDSNALTLAVLNLIDNAIKYAAAGKRIEVTVKRADDGVALEVRDFGPGVPHGEQAQVFERFYRARSVRLKPIRGSGIGLALVKHIIVAHNGRATVTSDPPDGATFRLWIPDRGHE
jgi:two-component system phosphate regulon sensor histidine kinase PhoR